MYVQDLEIISEILLELKKGLHTIIVKYCVLLVEIDFMQRKVILIIPRKAKSLLEKCLLKVSFSRDWKTAKGSIL